MGGIISSMWNGLWDGLSGSVPILKYFWLVRFTKMEGRSAEEKRRAKDMTDGIAVCWFYNILMLLISLFFFFLIDSVLHGIYTIVVRQSVIITSLMPFGQPSTRASEGVDETAQWWLFVSWLLLCAKEALWDVPVMLIGRACNFIWFRDIADCFPIVPRRSTDPAQKSHRSRTKASGSSKSNGGMVDALFKKLLDTLRMIASGWFAVIVQLVFLIQAYLVYGIPYVGTVLHYVHMSLFHAWYAFDYRLAKESVNLESTVRLLEFSWPYCVGFGLPLSLVATFSNHFVALPSGAVFSIFFPVLLVSAETLASLPKANRSAVALPILTPSYALANYAWTLIRRPTTTPARNRQD